MSEHAGTDPANADDIAKTNDSLDKTKESSVEEVRELIQIGRHFAGPLPPPEILHEYDALLPGAADRILIMAEAQSTHRQAMETKSLDADIEDRRAGRIEARIGQIFGLIIGMTAIIAGALVAPYSAWAGSLIGGGGVVGLVTAFIVGRHLPRLSSPEEDRKENS